MAQEPNIPMSVLRSLLDEDTFNQITGALKGAKAVGEKYVDIQKGMGRAALKGAKATGRAAIDTVAGMDEDMLDPALAAVQKLIPTSALPVKKLAEEGGKKLKRGVKAGISGARDMQDKRAVEEADSFMERIMKRTAAMGREQAAKEAAEEAAEEIVDEAAEEESPSMSTDYAGMPADGSSVEYQAAKNADMMAAFRGEDVEAVDPDEGAPNFEEMEMPEEKAAPKAKMALTPDQAKELFKTVHGGEFDPNSSMDKRKLKEIEETALEMGGLGDMSPNQFALKIYRKYKY